MKLLAIDGNSILNRAFYGIRPLSKAQELDLRFLDCAAALEAILSSDTVSALLAQDSALTIAVSGQDEAQCQDLLTQAQHCTAGQENAHCFSASSREHDEAHQAGLTLGKYRAYLALHDLDPTVTPEEVQTLTMAEIRDRIQALGGTLPTGSGEHSQTQAGHHGQGHHRHGNGHGGAHHGVVAHAQKAHHFHVKSACRRLCACGAGTFGEGIPTFRKTRSTSPESSMLCFPFLGVSYHINCSRNKMF